MKRFSACVCFIFLLILSGFFSNAAFAQDQSSFRGQLGGVVVDPTGAIIQGASITIMGPTGNSTRTTNEQGEFSFPGLNPGFYDVKVSKDGFKATTVQKVEVSINKTSTIKVALELGAVTQTVEVVATSVSVESQSTAVTADITDTVYNNLPLGRSITSTFYLSPGVSSGLGTGAQNPAISGATGLENAYVADGVLLNDAAFGGLGVYHRRYGGIGVGINASFVKEVQIITAGFPPQYGHATGGVVVMVTKSGGNAFHGTAGGYFQSRGMSASYANQDDFQQVNKIGRFLAPQAYEGDFQLGGYVPLGALRNHLFFFGAFNPTWNVNFVQPVTTSGLFTATNGVVDRKDTIWDYSAKVTWQLNQNHSLQGSVFGDPTHSDLAPWQTLNIDNTSANTLQKFGSRNVAASYNGTISPTLTLFAAFTMNWVNFAEAPLPVVNITDDTQTGGKPGVAAGTGQPALPKQRGEFRAQGFGSFENSDSNQKGIQFDVHKVMSILGQQHTLSAGYNWTFPTYNDTNGYSGGLFPIDVTNIDGGHYFGSNESAVTGQSAEFHTLLQLAPAGCTKCPYMDVPGFYKTVGGVQVYDPQQVVLLADRGPFSAFTSVNTSKNHSAYVNDDWEMSKYATLSLGLRWEQQRLHSGHATQLLNDQWGPRIGFTVDPKGDRKSKIYVNFGRYAWIMPLDAAIRELTAENEVENLYFAPDTANCSKGQCGLASPTNLVTLDQYNTVTFDPQNVLNNASGGVAVNPTVNLVSGGGHSPFAAGTKMEYTDEFVIGAEHEFRGGITASVRYIDRRIKRIIEDFQSVSVEQQLAGIAGFYAIGNPSAKTDVVLNSNEITWMPTATQVAAYNAALQVPGATPFAADPLLGPPAGCSDSAGNLTPKESGPVYNTLGTLLGAACFPAVNGQLNTSSTAKFGGEVGADGVPDGYPNATRNYQAIEIEINKSLSHNWSLLSNWRIARLIGNFEGAYRNDNGQNDPGISSLYDFTPGQLNLLGSLLVPGPLNADRLHIVNIYPTYTFDKSILRGLIVTPGVRIQSGLPLTTLAAQQAYTDQGEAILFKRGDLGRAPVTGTVDVHVDYPWRISESKSLHFEVDLMNIANTKRNLLINQNRDLNFGVLNGDFQAPGFGAVNAEGQNLLLGFVEPFSARFHVSFNF